MKNGRKIIVAIMFIIGVIALLVGTVAYYRIVVEGSIKATTGNAVFVLRDNDDSVWNNKVIDLGKVNPGDSGEFTVTMDATGSVVDMYATLEIERSNLPTNLKFYTTSDHKSELHKYYSFLETTNQTETLTIYWYWNPYINDEEDSKFINVSSLEANVRVSAIQISQYAMMKNGYSGTEFWNSTYKSYIRTVEFGNDLSDLPSSCTEENLCWDLSYSASQKKKVYGYLVDSGLKDSTDTTKTLYNLYIVSEAPIFAPFNCERIFRDFKNLMQINFSNNFNTSKVTDMSRMFYGCLSLGSLDIGSFNTSNVLDMSFMFSNCTSLANLNLSNFNTFKVTDMHNMFVSCSSFTKLDLSSFNTSNVTDMSFMFYVCKSLMEIVLDSFDTTNVTNMCSIFYHCSSLTSLNLSNFNTSNVTDMDNMFGGCSSLISLNLSSFNTSKVTDMHNMFTGCSSLTVLDLSNFNTSNVTDMGNMFYLCSSLINLNLDNFNTSNVTDMSGMFYFCSNLTTTINIMNANVTNYTDMFSVAATNSGAIITVNYIADASDLVDSMIATKSSDSNVVKGTQL